MSDNDRPWQPVDRLLILRAISFALNCFDSDSHEYGLHLLHELETRLLSDELIVHGRVFDSRFESEFFH